MVKYIKKCLHIYTWNALQWINRHVLRTYPLIEDCARCRDCGTNVHDFGVPEGLWEEVVGKEIVLCYDCFCDRADRRLKMKWRYELKERWNNQEGEVYGRSTRKYEESKGLDSTGSLS